MPNHVYHYFSMTSDLSQEQIDKLNTIAETHNGLCGYYLPMPEEIRNTTSPTRIVSETEYKRIMKENESIDRTQLFFYEPKPITKKMQKALLEKYGVDNWYDWAYDKWDTKWGCYDSELDGFTLHCTTAWSPMSLDIVREFAKDFPNFTWHWEEEQGFGATYVFENGEFVVADEYDAIEFTHICEYLDEEDITQQIVWTKGRPESMSTEEVQEGFYMDYSFEGGDYLGTTLPEYIINQLENKNLTELYMSTIGYDPTK